MHFKEFDFIGDGGADKTLKSRTIAECLDRRDGAGIYNNQISTYLTYQLFLFSFLCFFSLHDETSSDKDRTGGSLDKKPNPQAGNDRRVHAGGLWIQVFNTARNGQKSVLDRPD